MCCWLVILGEQSDTQAFVSGHSKQLYKILLFIGAPVSCHRCRATGLLSYNGEYRARISFEGFIRCVNWLFYYRCLFCWLLRDLG